MNTLNKNNFLIDKILFWICILYPLILLAGRFFSDLITVIFSIYFFFNYKKFNYKKFNYNFIFFFILSYFTIIFMNFFSFDISISFKKILPHFRFVLFLIVLSYIMNKFYNKIYYLFYSLVLVIIFLSTISFIQYFYNIYFNDNLILRVSGYFGKEKILGGFVLRLLPILIFSIFLILEKKIKFKNMNFLFFLLIFLSILLIFIAGERASLLLLILFIFLFFCFIKNKYIKKIFFISILFSIISILSFSFIYSKKISTRYDIVISSIETKSISTLLVAHENLFKTAYKMFLDKPFHGQGSHSFRYLCSNKKFYSGEGSCTTHPHNYYLELLAESGIVVFLMYFIFYLYCCNCLIKFFYSQKIKSFQNPLLILIIGILILFWPLTTTGSFLNNYLNCFNYFNLGLFHLILNRTKKII